MKKAVVLAATLLFLTGCSHTSKELEKGMELRSELLKASQCSFDTQITADYGDKTYTFSMRCQGDAQGNVTFTVTEPETIAGITGSVSDSGGKLTFDDTALEFELMADDQVTPVSGPWILLKTLRSGYITSAGMDGERLRLSIDDSYEDDALHLDIWVNDKQEPTAAEIRCDDRNILSLTVTNFVLG